MTIMNRPRLRCLYVAVVAMACGVMPATQSTAGTTATRGMSGTAANVCSLNTTSVSVSVVKNNGGTTATFTPSSVTVFCNRSLGATLSVQSTRLTRLGQGTFFDYKLSVAGWTTASVDYTTNLTPPAATTSSIGNAVSKTLIFTGSGYTFSSNDTYTGTITLGLSPN